MHTPQTNGTSTLIHLKTGSESHMRRLSTAHCVSYLVSYSVCLFCYLVNRQTNVEVHWIGFTVTVTRVSSSSEKAQSYINTGLTSIIKMQLPRNSRKKLGFKRQKQNND